LPGGWFGFWLSTATERGESRRLARRMVGLRAELVGVMRTMVAMLQAAMDR